MKRVFIRSAVVLSTVTSCIILQACTGGPIGNECPTSGTAGNASTVSYANDIVPLFIETNCLSTACHGGIVPSSRFDLRTYESTFIAGDDARQIGACEITPGDPDNSFLMEKLRSADPRVGLQMPLEREPLTAAQLAIIETWIREGAQNN